MQYRKLGSSDLKLSVLGLGCNNFGGRTDLETTRRVMHHAIDAGINHFDTADIYGGQGASEDSHGSGAGAAPQGHRAGDEIRPAVRRRRHA